MGHGRQRPVQAGAPRRRGQRQEHLPSPPGRRRPLQQQIEEVPKDEVGPHQKVDFCADAAGLRALMVLVGAEGAVPQGQKRVAKHRQKQRQQKQGPYATVPPSKHTCKQIDDQQQPRIGPQKPFVPAGFQTGGAFVRHRLHVLNLVKQIPSQCFHSVSSSQNSASRVVPKA